MSRKNSDVADDLAQSMSDVLAEEDYQNIFKKPEVKKVASDEKPESEANPVSDAFGKLLEVSAVLDEMGLTKTAASVLEAAEEFVSEMSEKDLDAAAEQAEAEIVVSED